MRRLLSIVLVGLAMRPAGAAEARTAPSSGTEYVEVKSTPIPEDSQVVPASITVLDGDELRSFGQSDLRSALRLVAGIDIGQGGDAGPAGAVPEIWGLREFDAFLLVIDGVPWGGAFNPELSSLSLRDVARVEIVRGPAPVVYGATSFSGVIQVIHRSPGEGVAAARLAAGSHGSGDADVALDVPGWLGFRSRLLVDGEHREFADPRTGFDRGHLLWRNTREVGAGHLRLDLDYAYLAQLPASPHPREDGGLSPAIPLDANHNPLGSFIDPRRGTIDLGYDRSMGSGRWTTLLSASRTLEGSLRGFLVDLAATDTNAHGFREDVGLTELYLDSRYEITPRPGLTIVTGLDYLHGQGSAHGGDFDYFVPLDGSGTPSGDSLPSQASIAIGDRRDFAGLYGYAAWAPGASRFRLEGGARLNLARESRDTSTLDLTSGDLEIGGDSRSDTRLNGSVGATFTAWQRREDAVRVYADYRNTFKPAAMDFGLDASPDILEPETADTYEVGVRTTWLDRRVEVEASAFRMDMANLVVSQVVNGLPALANAGAERFRGAEVELEARIRAGLSVRGGYSLHDARFRDFVQDFDGTPTQLAGNRVEMSPRHLATIGVVHAPRKGLTAHADLQYVGSRYLDRRNTALAPAYTTWAAGVGYRVRGVELRVDGQNLNDTRPPTSESELGDAQYYRLYPRHIEASVRWEF